MDCRKKEVDVFVTKDSYNEFDDTYAGAVWSVDLQESSTGTYKARIVNRRSHWITLIGTGDKVAPNGVYDAIEVGDLVRIGDNQTGFTDYCTVLEKVKLTKLSNFVHNLADIYVTTGTPSNKNTSPATYAQRSANAYAGADSLIRLPKATVGTTANFANPLAEASTTTNNVTTITGETAFTEFAYRLNMSVNATAPPVPPKFEGQEEGVVATKTLTDRHTMQVDPALAYEGTFVNAAGQGQLYPLYVAKKWLADRGRLGISLNNGASKLHAIKLVGYSVFDKRQGGFQTNHELIHDDFISLHIKQIPGRVVSNNNYANGAFCVLHVGNSRDNNSGAIEYNIYEPNGLHVQHLDTPVNLNNLTLQMLDRNGDQAHFGRIHLWFKLTVSND